MVDVVAADHGDGRCCLWIANYEALRAVFRRVNELLGTNYSMHDLRHTASLRMARDKTLSLKDVQVILGHAHLSTTADVYLAEDYVEVVRRVRQHLAAAGAARLAGGAAPGAAPTTTPATCPSCSGGSRSGPRRPPHP